MDDMDLEALDPKMVRAFLLGVIVAMWLVAVLAAPSDNRTRIVLFVPKPADSDDDAE